MILTIHRGTREIGGTCVQLEAQGASILLDAGLPLADTHAEVDLASLRFSDVLISHPHLDHSGLIDQLDSSKTVHIGELSRRFMDATRLFLGKEKLANTFQYFRAWERFDIGPFSIEPYLMDHSAVDAYGFLIEADGKRIFYSGDFRAHGRKGKVFERLVANPPAGIDALLMEGTMMGRENAAFPDERAVESAIYEALKTESGPCFLIASSQNIDRMCAAYRACKRAGRIFVVDIYTAWVLRETSEFFDTTPNLGWKDVRVLSRGKTAARHYSRIKGKAGFEAFIKELYREGNVVLVEEIKAAPHRYFIKNNYADFLIDTIGHPSASLVYSMWEGYLEERHNPGGFKQFQALKQDPRIRFSEIHTSGHAVREDLQRLATALRPKMLIPIHTERANEYIQYFNNVCVLADGEPLTI